jgi:carbonic anhydrase/acetyltransferase-like protein (isoleucine patch superfamily)
MALYSLNGQAPDMPAADACYVAENAVVIGKVRIKAGVSIWFGAVARGDNEWIEIGERTNIQENCTLHTDPGYPLTVGAGCTVGHHAILHGCTIGRNCLIGMGAILMNGAQIGANCIIGAGALVGVGELKTIPDNSLVVGAPARVSRSIGDDAVKYLEYAAEFYFKRWQNYAANLKRIA